MFKKLRDFGVCIRRTINLSEICDMGIFYQNKNGKPKKSHQIHHKDGWLTIHPEDFKEIEEILLGD